MATLGEALGLTATVETRTASDAASSAQETIERAAMIEALAELDAIEIDPNITTKDLLTKMLETKAYRRSVFSRLVAGSLPAAVECKIYDHAMGKPVDHVEINDKTKVENLSVEELHERINRTTVAIQKIMQAQASEAQH